MTKFQEEIARLAKDKKKDNLKKQETGTLRKDGETTRKTKEAMDRLFTLAEAGAKTYDEILDCRELSVCKLPEEFLTVFFNFSEGRTGFCIISDRKFVIFFDEQPDQVIVLGKKRQNDMPGNAITGARQLIRITCVISENSLIFKDNTGAALDIEDTLIQIIRWIISE